MNALAYIHSARPALWTEHPEAVVILSSIAKLNAVYAELGTVTTSDWGTLSEARSTIGQARCVWKLDTTYQRQGPQWIASNGTCAVGLLMERLHELREATICAALKDEGLPTSWERPRDDEMQVRSQERREELEAEQPTLADALARMRAEQGEG